MILLPILIFKTVKPACYLARRSSLTVNYTEDFGCFIAYFSTTGNDSGNNIPDKNIKLPIEPQNCCMSGCANCVWIAYAEELAKILNDGGETAKQKILEQVKDPNLRAFLMVELHHLFKEKK